MGGVGDQLAEAWLADMSGGDGSDEGQEWINQGWM